MMVQVSIDSVRVSLMSQHRIVVLKDEDSALPAIWIGPFEADAITIELQGVEVARPLTHDLLKDTIEKLGAEIEQVAITDLRDDTFYAEMILRVNGRRMVIDSRPSDAIALAVRSECRSMSMTYWSRLASPRNPTSTPAQRDRRGTVRCPPKPPMPSGISWRDWI